jgi:hypothetical protein
VSGFPPDQVSEMIELNTGTLEFGAWILEFQLTLEVNK